MTAVERFLEAIGELDAEELLDERARRRVAITALASFNREQARALAERDSGQLSLDGERAA